MGDGAMCRYCRKYQCECHLTAEEWRERCRTAEDGERAADAEVERLLQESQQAVAILEMGGRGYTLRDACRNRMQEVVTMRGNAVEDDERILALQSQVSRLTVDNGMLQSRARNAEEREDYLKAEVARLTRFQQNVAAACMKMYDDLIYFRRAIEVHLGEFGDETRQQKERG